MQDPDHRETYKPLFQRTLSEPRTLSQFQTLSTPQAYHDSTLLLHIILPDLPTFIPILPIGRADSFTQRIPALSSLFHTIPAPASLQKIQPIASLSPAFPATLAKHSCLSLPSVTYAKQFQTSSHQYISTFRYVKETQPPMAYVTYHISTSQ